MLSQFDAVLIDDDPLVRMSWKMVAQQKGKALLVFSNIEECREKLEMISRSTPIFIDSQLGVGVKGEDFALELHHIGFTEIFLSTGYRSSDLGQISGVKGVVGKDPPF